MNNKRNILITGANSGLGAELSKLFASKDHRLFLTARNQDRLDSLADQVRMDGAEVITKSLDVADYVAVNAWLTEIDQRFPLDLIIANAGIMTPTAAAGAFEEADKSADQIATNLNAVINITSQGGRAMADRKKGQIVLIGSLSAVQPISRAPTYSATKAAIVAYGEAMRGLLDRHNVMVTVVCPGFIKTDMADAMETWQPFKMTAADAARKTKKAIDHKRAFSAFPLPLVLASRFGKLLPWPLRKLATRGFD